MCYTQYCITLLQHTSNSLHSINRGKYPLATSKFLEQSRVSRRYQLSALLKPTIYKVYTGYWSCNSLLCSVEHSLQSFSSSVIVTETLQAKMANCGFALQTFTSKFSKFSWGSMPPDPDAAYFSSPRLIFSCIPVASLEAPNQKGVWRI